MIDLYYAPTPNGHKITIALEELGLPYTLNRINLGKGDQFASDFLAISPNNKIPAIVDHDGFNGQPVSIFETGAILIYLAEKTGKLMPVEAGSGTQDCSGVVDVADGRLWPNAGPGASFQFLCG